jgi:toxin ParE1/3/4
MNLVIGPEAEVDLAEIYEYIAADRPRAAERMLDQLRAVMQRLADGEFNGPAARLPDGRRVHGWPVPPYRIYYQRTIDQTVIVRGYHGARRPIE